MTEATPSLQGHYVNKRATKVRAEIETAQTHLEQLHEKQRTAMRDFQGQEDGGKNNAHLREVGREIKAVEEELAMLNTRLTVARELDAEEGVTGAQDEFDAHLAAAMKHLQARAPFADKLEEGFRLLQEGLQGYEDANTAANRHLHEAGRQLPRKLNPDLGHAIRSHVSGSYSIHALMHALLTSGVGKTGITAGVLLDTAGQVPEVTFVSALAQCNDRIASMLHRWRSLVKGEQRDEPIVTMLPPAPPPPPEVKWADETPILFCPEAHGLHLRQRGR
jgi:hypothetical protein